MLHKPMTSVFAILERSVDSSRFFSRITPFLARFAHSGWTAPLRRQQLLFGRHQIRQSKQAEQLRCVLDEALVANLSIAKQILDDVERMLDPSPNPGLGSLNGNQQFFHHAVTHRLDLAAPDGYHLFLFNNILGHP